MLRHRRVMCPAVLNPSRGLCSIAVRGAADPSARSSRPGFHRPGSATARRPGCCWPIARKRRVRRLGGEYARRLVDHRDVRRTIIHRRFRIVGRPHPDRRQRPPSSTSSCFGRRHLQRFHLRLRPSRRIGHTPAHLLRFSSDGTRLVEREPEHVRRLRPDCRIRDGAVRRRERNVSGRIQQFGDACPGVR